MRDQLWPDQQEFLWNRKANKGFATIPKTLPLILNIMDEMTKGAPVSATYLALWCSTWDNSYIPITKPGEMSIMSGFGGQRGEHTWAGRMKKLQELHFISIKPGKSGPMSHVVILNPHIIVRYHHDIAKTSGMTEASFTGLIERAMEIGALDMLQPLSGMSPSPEGPIPTLVAGLRDQREKAAQQAAALAAEAARVAAAVAALPLPMTAPPAPVSPMPMPMPIPGAVSWPAAPAAPSPAPTTNTVQTVSALSPTPGGS